MLIWEFRTMIKSLLVHGFLLFCVRISLWKQYWNGSSIPLQIAHLPLLNEISIFGIKRYLTEYSHHWNMLRSLSLCLSKHGIVPVMC
jgi:hypothetical protein